MNVTARSFIVIWSPPTDINAPEINYTLRLTGPSSNVTEFPGIQAEMRLVDDLMPFTDYMVVVFAVSEKGAGNDSDTRMVMTSEDGKYMYMYHVQVCAQTQDFLFNFL